MPTRPLRSAEETADTASSTDHSTLVFSPPPAVRLLSDILPDDPLLMMGAGPVPIPDVVAHANSVVINHLGTTMSTIISQVKQMAGYVFQTRSEWVLGVAGPGSAAMEMAICNLVSADSKVLCVVNGFFSARMAEMSRRLGADVITYEVEGNQAASAEAVERAIAQHHPDVLTIVQGETSNTVFNRELPAIARAAKKHGCLVVVDAVCTLSTMPLQMDDWQIDAVITGGQKGLSSIPGVSLIAFSNAAWERINQRKTPNTHWVLDAKLAENFWHKGSYHYTAPVSGVLALHEALRLVCAETLPVRFARHSRSSFALQNGIEAMGLRLFAPPSSRLNSVVGIVVPDGLSNTEICAHISNRYRVEISGSFGLPIVRIGQMGEQCRVHNLFRTLHALGSTMRDLGAKVDMPASMSTLEYSLQTNPAI
ncbi:MAG: alanine--glyoxylate aminotransferase family protein [Pigmentiphaga sp.]|uniref:pyridoxal-phosphate-dependent aminotransferase family protein n=1 Tax=Pigmentiphaga sp. TaxID=1977564 RepID=UPI0029B2280A|nr:alanine--glyoxylate aminotransferase family protein [Pigmentiphaga sp.]MDX3905463.1 alanine--glyoxylate aminotransferase family protein [Pigmentiphaga sp.]